MNEQTIRTALLETSVHIIEQAAYIFADPAQHVADIAAPREYNGWSVSYKGDPSGKLCFWAADNFQRQAAANMLGLSDEQELSDAQCDDAMRELLNMIAGNFLTRLYGLAPVFSLDIPKQLAPSALAKDLGGALTIQLDAEGKTVLISHTC
jgi:CheY-specific phosphatase CheX